MDGTLIGKISPSICEYEILKELQPKKLAAFKKQLTTRLQYGPLRPHLAAFCKRARVLGIPLFVYTASEDRWAHVVIPCIEQSIGVRFERPFFTRTSCYTLSSTMGVDYRKSIDRILGGIHRRLKKSHGMTMPLAELREHTVLIDNNPDVMHLPDERRSLIRCPTYNYMYVYDVLANLDIETLHAMFHRAGPILKRHSMLPPGTDVNHQTYQQFMESYYGSLAAMLRQSYIQNVHSLKTDRFWLTVWDKLSSSASHGDHKRKGARSAHPLTATKRVVESHHRQG
jgi:hypothetical protein